MNVEDLLSALRAGMLSQEARRWLIGGFEGWLCGQSLEEALGLQSEPLDRRDEVLRLLIQLSPGSSETARCCFLVDCLNGDQEHPAQVAASMINKLQASGVPLPKSIRHLTRIAAGGRSDRKTEGPVLCPDWPVPQTAGN